MKGLTHYSADYYKPVAAGATRAGEFVKPEFIPYSKEAEVSSARQNEPHPRFVKDETYGEVLERVGVDDLIQHEFFE